jgi:DNA uptake protein ComE-like DNA-binding protein
MIDYQVARYGCDSALKYAFSNFRLIKTELIRRANEPDFSDVFSLTEQEYEELLTEWSIQKDEKNETDEIFERPDDINDVNGVNDINDVNGYDFFADDVNDLKDANSTLVRGPYGPEWPLVTDVVEFEIGKARVKIEIEDENAKYPLSWVMLNDAKLKREVKVGLEVFCEWMSMDTEQIKSLSSQLEDAAEVKPFKLRFKPITSVVRKKARRTRGRRKSSRRARVERVTTSALVHTTDIAELLHSSLVDTETLARPTVISDARTESAHKYIGLWGSARVNINSAPRHVLEAAFAFGGDGEKIAAEIIQLRRQQPFANINDLKKKLFSYSSSIGKCEKFITTSSRFFTVRVTSISGVASASAVIAVIKKDKKIEKIAVIGG